MEATGTMSPNLSSPGADAAAFRYCAFLSYSHRDKLWANWLHGALERYQVPKNLVGRITTAGPVPERLAPIFRDREELSASDDLGENIRAALAGSRFLIVLCSPAAAASRWTNEEIASFKRLHPDGRVLAAIVAGEPHASDMPGREAEECFAHALRHRFGPDGEPTDARAEPIAADFRDGADGRRIGKLKLIAGMLGIGLDELVRREAHRRQRRLTWLAAASVAGMGVTSGLAVAAVQARNEAQHERGEAEGLIEFMLTDLRQKLEPVGRLEALDGVGRRALAYYDQQQLEGLDPDSLSKRSRALHLIGEVRDLQGDSKGALVAFRQAAATTRELLARGPGDEQRIFDHAQSVFWVGQVDWQRGDANGAEAAFKEYDALAKRLVRVNPSKDEWQLEAGHASSNLGTMLLQAGRPDEALKAFAASRESYARVSPSNRDGLWYMAQSGGWIANALEDLGRLDAARRSRSDQIKQYARMPKAASDAEAREGVLVARRELGRLNITLGRNEEGLRDLAEAVRLGQSLTQTDPDNQLWAQGSLVAQLEYAAALDAAGNSGLAWHHLQPALASIERMIARDSSNVQWRMRLSGPALVLASRCAPAERADGIKAQLSHFVSRFGEPGALTDRKHRAVVAAAHLALGDMEAGSAAVDHWRSAERLVASPAAHPASLAALTYAEALMRLRQTGAAETLLARMSESEFKHPRFQRISNRVPRLLAAR